jgi:hypothetical protein
MNNNNTALSQGIINFLRCLTRENKSLVNINHQQDFFNFESGNPEKKLKPPKTENKWSVDKCRQLVHNHFF